MTQQFYINGQWVSPVLGGTFDTINPATEQVIECVAAGTQDDIDKAVLAAQQAFMHWSQTNGHERADWLNRLADELEKHQDELAQLEVLDNGKPLAEAIWDVADAVGCFRFYATLAKALDSKQDTPLNLSSAQFSCTLRYEPVGVAAMIIPWNYPLLMAVWKVAPALAAGATCILKPSEYTPLSALRLAKLADNIGLPAGVLNVVTGLGSEAGQALSMHPGIDKIAFTGSVPTGKRIMAAAVAGIKNISLELGGKSPIIVYDDADIDQAVEWIMMGIYFNQGQVCSATSRLIIQETIAEQLLPRLVHATQKIVIGAGCNASTQLGPLVSAAQYQKVMNFIEQGRQANISLLCGGKRPIDQPYGYFIEPTIFDDPPLSHPLWQEEIFGPVLVVKRFKTEAQALQLANQSQYGLAGAVMSTDQVKAQRTANQLRAGIVWINCSQPTFSQAPWGGMKQSGIGRELGEWGLYQYLEVKQVTHYHSNQAWGWYLT